MALSTVRCGCRGDIRQLADVAAGRAENDELVEIRISLDRIDPPAGLLCVITGPPRVPDSGQGVPLRFTGWLGMLRALYEVIGSSGGGAPGGP